jgi:hypothetical protein
MEASAKFAMMPPVKQQPRRRARANAAEQSLRTGTDARVRLRHELTDAEWQPIKDILAAVGKDADQLTEPMIKGNPLLRKALPLIASDHVLDARLKKQAPTLKQAVAELQETLKITTGLLERLSDPSNYDWLNPLFRQMFFKESQARDELLIPNLSKADSLGIPKSPAT